MLASPLASPYRLFGWAAGAQLASLGMEPWSALSVGGPGGPLSIRVVRSAQQDWYPPILSIIAAWKGSMSRNEDLSFLAGGGEMGQRTRELDWGDTPVGPPGEWQQSLKTAVSICLGSRHPIVIWWGNGGYVQFYNDAYISFLGAGKHPTYLGGSGRDCWSEIWSTIGPMLDGVFASGEATWSEDLLLVLDRNLAREEAYFTFSYSPIRDDHGAVGGIFCACNETTSRVIGERRLRTLSELSRVEAEIKTTEAACEVACRTLIGNPADIPFALIYLLDEGATQAKLQARTRCNGRSCSRQCGCTATHRLGERRRGAVAAKRGVRYTQAVGGFWPLEQVWDTARRVLAGLSRGRPDYPHCRSRSGKAGWFPANRSQPTARGR